MIWDKLQLTKWCLANNLSTTTAKPMRFSIVTKSSQTGMRAKDIFTDAIAFVTL